MRILIHLSILYKVPLHTWSKFWRCDSYQKSQGMAKRVPTQCQTDAIIFRQILQGKDLNKSENEECESTLRNKK